MIEITDHTNMDRLNALIKAGWGDISQEKIPAPIYAAAVAGEPVPQNPREHNTPKVDKPKRRRRSFCLLENFVPRRTKWGGSWN